MEAPFKHGLFNTWHVYKTSLQIPKGNVVLFVYKRYHEPLKLKCAYEDGTYAITSRLTLFNNLEVKELISFNTVN